MATDLREFVQGGSPAGSVPGVNRGTTVAPAPQPFNPLAGLPSGGATPEVFAPDPGFDTINKNATARATADVNPIYTKYLNDFLGTQAQQQATQKAITDQAVQNAQDTLKDTLKSNEITGARTTADTATKLNEANIATDWRQTDQGGQYDIDRVAQAVQQAKAGLTGSGLAAGQQGASQTAFNTKESRQATGDAQQKAATQLAQSRTFEDLARSGELATQAEGKQEKAAQFDLTTFMQNQGMQLQDEQQKLEQQRQNQVAQTQAKYKQDAVVNFYKTITNPAQKAAYIKAYGNYF